MKEKIPAYPRPVLFNDRRSYTWRASQRRMHILSILPEDVDARLTISRIAGGMMDPRGAPHGDVARATSRARRREAA